MSDELLAYYDRELTYLRRLGAEFAAAHPKIAGRLRITPDAVEDPHVSRLVESVAFLNARIRKKLDDQFPELTDSLLSVLHPQSLAPLPSMAIAQFECDPELTSGYTIPRGTMLETERIEGQPVHFRTCAPAVAWPIRIESARLAGTPFTAPQVPLASHASAVLRIVLRTAASGTTFGVLAPESLRFHLKGQENHAHALYELLFNSLTGICVATSPRDANPAILRADCLSPVGFERADSMLPQTGRDLPGARLLTEFFAFPARFLFFDLSGIPARKLREAAGALELYLFFDRSNTDLEQSVSHESLALGCAPIVNLFQKRAEPTRLTHVDSEYRIVADARRPRAVEVYSIDAVSASAPSGERRVFQPLYGTGHGGESRANAWWHAARRAAPPGADQQDHGTEVYISLVDLDFQPSAPSGWILEVQTTCLNRDLPARLPVAPRLSFSSGGGPIKSLRCLTNPTRTLRRAQGGPAYWQLISSLSLNHLSLVGGEQATEALRELLRLHDVPRATDAHSIVEGVLSVRSRPATMRVVSGGLPGYCRGTEVELQLDEQRFAGQGLLLFGYVMERFLAQYGTLNTFVQLVLTTNRRQGALRRWPPRAGEQALL